MKPVESPAPGTTGASPRPRPSPISAVAGETVTPLKWAGDRLLILDQRLLPHQTVWLECRTAGEVAASIKDMAVRGAPAIGVAAAYGYALAARTLATGAAEQSAATATATPVPASAMLGRLAEESARLLATRPTAVNLAWALRRMEKVAAAAVAGSDSAPASPGAATRPTTSRGAPGQLSVSATALADRLTAEAIAIQREDVEINRRIGLNGAPLLADGGVLTHCNAGALATAGYGTALGVVRAAAAGGRNLTVYVDETRPYLQGARLTAWEMVQEGIDSVLITDSMAASVMRAGKVKAVVVGADRIAANGDTANKIGTYGLAVLAKEHHIPFYVAAPLSTIDPATATGKDIPIEERNPDEVTHLAGQRVAADGVRVYNPSFDVTPAEHITAIITEEGVIRPPFDFATLGRKKDA